MRVHIPPVGPSCSTQVETEPACGPLVSNFVIFQGINGHPQRDSQRSGPGSPHNPWGGNGALSRSAYWAVVG